MRLSGLLRPPTAPPQGSALRYSAWSLVALACWLLVGELGIAMRERWATPTGLVVLARHGASDTTVSLLLSTLPAVLGLFLVPYIGMRSDRHRGRWGRRRPFLMACALLGALAMAGAACAPALAAWLHALLGARSPGMRALDLGCFAVFWTLFDCAAITSAALFSGLVNDVMPRRFVGRFYAAFRVVGLGVAIGFNAWVLALTETHLAGVLLVIALVFGVATPLMCLMIREPPRCQAPAPATAPAAAAGAGVPRRRCLWAFGAFMLAAVTFSPFNTFSQSYALSLGIARADLGALTAQAYAVSIASAFGVGWLADRVGALRLSALTMGLYCALALAGCLLVEDAATFRVFYLAHVVVSGAYFTAASSMPMALFPQAEFVRYNASKDSAVALAGIAVSACQGPLLDWSGHAYGLTLGSAAVFSLLCLACMGQLLRGRR